MGLSKVGQILELVLHSFALFIPTFQLRFKLKLSMRTGVKYGAVTLLTFATCCSNLLNFELLSVREVLDELDGALDVVGCVAMSSSALSSMSIASRDSDSARTALEGFSGGAFALPLPFPLTWTACDWDRDWEAGFREREAGALWSRDWLGGGGSISSISESTLIWVCCFLLWLPLVVFVTLGGGSGSSLTYSCRKI